MLRDRFPAAKFVLGQLGTRPQTIAELPRSYFDLVCSVGVLEEIGDEDILMSILRHAGALLRVGGILANTHGIVFESPRRSKLLVSCLRSAGFEVELTEREAEILNSAGRYVPWNKALFENPTQAMLCHNVGSLDRKYAGHRSTLWSSVGLSEAVADLDPGQMRSEAIGSSQNSIEQETAIHDESGGQALESDVRVASLNAELVRRDAELAELRRQLATTRAYIGVE
jgi:hypothetical protein